MNPRVTLLGAGIMGAGMAERLLDQGFAVGAWDRTPAATARLAERGATAHTDRARLTLEPVFSALGQRVLWLGPAGQGTRMKLVLNTWLAFEVEAAAEVSAAAHRLGLPYKAVLDAVQGGPLVSGTALARLAKMENADHSPQFPLEWALKDLDLVAAATGAGTVPIAGAIADRWRGLVGRGYGRLDASAARLGLDGDSRATQR